MGFLCLVSPLSTSSHTSHLKLATVSSIKRTAISITSLKTTTQTAQVLFSTDIMKQAKQRSEKQRKARLLSSVKKIIGYDANALYLWALMEDMPTGSYTRRLAEHEFKPKSSIKMAIQWLEWVAHQDRIHIRHQLNNTEKCIGHRKLPVDGFNVESQTVYQFQGCNWHGHDCALNRGKEVNEKRNRPMTELLEETRANTEYIWSKGYRVVEMWECEWRRMKRTNRELQRFIATEVRRTLDTIKIMSPERILSEVKRPFVWLRWSGYSCAWTFEREIQWNVPHLQKHQHQPRWYWRLHESVRRGA